MIESRSSNLGQAVEKCWYLARNNLVAGPFSEEQIRQFASANQLSSADMVQKAGSGVWEPIPEFLASLQTDTLIPLAEPVPVPSSAREVRVTCFACYAEVTIALETGKSTANCPKCRNEILIESEAEAPTTTNDFDGIGGSLTERIEQDARSR